MMTRNLCRDFEYNLARNVKQNPKAFWRYCRSKIKNRSKLGDLKMADGKLTGEDETKADLLNSFFVSVFTHENTDIPVLEDKYHKPKILILENVKNFEKHDKGNTLKLSNPHLKR